MKSNRVMLRVEEFRAIGKAEIKLDGITVVAGVNGCGKSTLSKLLYWVYRSTLNFEVLTKPMLTQHLSTFIQIIENTLNFSYSTNKNQDDTIKLLFYWQEIKSKIINNGITPNELFDFIEEISKIDDFTQNKNITEYYGNLIELELNDNSYKTYHGDNNITMSNIILLFKSYIKKAYKLHNELMILRPNWVIEEKITEVFHTTNLPKLFEIMENNLIIFSTNQINTTQPNKFDNVIYIDTPMFFGHTEEEHWKDANEKLKQRPKLNEKPKPIQEIDDLIKRQIFRNGAEVKFDELSESFTFRTSSGVEMDLSDSATGMKTFAVLDRLVKNGSINKKTLLILDEPEAHLHPQWIVELGRLLTLINKHIGAKIFVATHSPDMVQALRYIPNKEKIGDNVNFYLAEFNQENGLFDYRDLQGEIDDIFGSFNLSLDKLSNYGED